MKRTLSLFAFVVLVLTLQVHPAIADAPILVSAADGFGGGYGAWSMQPDGSHIEDRALSRPVANPAWDWRRRGFFYTYFVKPPYEVHLVSEGSGSRITHNTITEFVLDAAPNGHRLVSAAERASYGDIYTISLRSGEFRRLTSSPVDDWSPDWSPDGKRLVWVRDGELWIMGGHGQDRQRVGEGIAAASPTWSPDGSSIMYVGARGNIVRVRPDGGGLQVIVADVDVWGSELLTPLWSPDGRSVAFTAARDNEVAEEWTHRIYILRLDSGRIRNITPDLGSDQGAVTVDW